MTPESLSVTAGILISLIANFVPAYENLSKSQKQLWMIGAMVTWTAVLVGAGCFGLYDAVSCTANGIVQALQVLGSAIAGAVLTHVGTKEITKGIKSKWNS